MAVAAATRTHGARSRSATSAAGPPLGQRQPVIFQFIAPASDLDVHCQDCESTVTLLLGAPACVASTFAVRHSDGCPRLADLMSKRAS
jgi:hypothetical protein